ncbi:MAG: nucleoside triphosphate pyrophosphatase [Pirellulales bacterium]
MNRSDPKRPALILASGSPQRQRLLEQAGYSHRVVLPSPHAECGVCSRETPPELVARLAYQKAADVFGQLAVAAPTAEILVACDTVAECAGHILGKPAGRDHARTMLELLRGRVHHVYSGLCVWPLLGTPHVQVARTTLRMDTLSDAQIAEYLQSGLWEGKAGAFGYQDRAGWLHIEEGSESNVIGLPLELLGAMLATAAGEASGDGAGPAAPL